MSAEVFNFAQFKSGKPIPALPQAKLDFALRLALVALEPPLIRNCRHASVDDIQAAIDAIGHVHALYVEFITTVTSRLNENMSVCDTVDIKDLVAGLADLKSDMIGMLAIRAERIMENV